MKRFVTICAVVVTLLCAHAKAGFVQYATDAEGGTWYYPGGGTVGTEFVVNENLTLTQLGILDYGHDGLAGAHNVALFDTVGNILASATIGAGTSNPLVNGYRWADTSFVALVQGTHYVIGAQYIDAGVSDYFRDTATIDPKFTLVADLYLDGTTFAMPTTTYFGDGLRGWYGPNLIQAVPLPASILLGAFAVGLAGRKLRKFV